MDVVCSQQHHHHIFVLIFSCYKAEENDILDRAHRFLLRVRPDPAHCKLPSLTTATPAQSGILCESNNNQQVLSQDVSDLLVLSPVCYVVSEASYIKSKDTMQRARLPLGKFQQNHIL